MGQEVKWYTLPSAEQELSFSEQLNAPLLSE